MFTGVENFNLFSKNEGKWIGDYKIQNLIKKITLLFQSAWRHMATCPK